jgi:FkbM family methyltransferase
MIDLLKNLLKKALKHVNLGVLQYSRLLALEKSDKAGDDLDFLLAMPAEHVARLLHTLCDSKSGLHQDLFVLSELEFKTGGFFVEFGATDGVAGSNTLLLEKEFGWNGILAEPARHWQPALRQSRNCSIETDCVWRETGQTLTFNETDFGELSTIDSFSSSDSLSWGRTKGKKYPVNTISLIDLLDKYKSPRTVDYLSIDTEGSEFEILSGFDFSKYRFRVITCEHNLTRQREKIFALLTENGYVRKLEELSGVDDWYVRVEEAET